MGPQGPIPALAMGIWSILVAGKLRLNNGLGDVPAKHV